MFQKHSRRIVAIAGVILFALFAVIYLKQGASPEILPERGMPAAGFYDAAGNKLTLQDFKNKVVLVNLWATWCPPCVAELPSLDALQAKLKDRDFIVVAISLDRTDMKTVTDFLQARGVEHLTPYHDRDRDIPLKWTYSGLPVSFLLDEEGMMIDQFDGPQEWHDGEVFERIRKAAH